MLYEIKSTRRLSNFLVVLIWLSIVLNIILFAGSLFSDIFYIRDLETEKNSGNHIFLVLLLWTYVFLFIVFFWLAEFVTFLLWFGRIYINIYKQRVGLIKSPKWAVLSWLIPLYNIVAPLFLMRKLFNTVNNLLEVNGRTERLKVRRLTWWWGLIVIESLLVILIFALSLMKSTPELLVRLEFVTLLCSTISSVLCIRLVKSYVRVESILSIIVYNKKTF